MIKLFRYFDSNENKAIGVIFVILVFLFLFMIYWSFFKLTFTDAGNVNTDYIHPLADIHNSNISQTINQYQEESKGPNSSETFNVWLSLTSRKSLSAFHTTLVTTRTYRTNCQIGVWPTTKRQTTRRTRTTLDKLAFGWLAPGTGPLTSTTISYV